MWLRDQVAGRAGRRAPIEAAPRKAYRNGESSSRDGSGLNHVYAGPAIGGGKGS
jgi:hypothetical protein